VTKIERFEDIKAWQEARVLVSMVYEAVKSDKGFFIQYLLSNMNDCPILIDVRRFFEPARVEQDGFYYRSL
jgi:hypothetical protein